MRATFRPLPVWPYPEQKARPATYRATYSRTLQDLEREIEALRGRELIIGVVADESQVRIDGQMRADAKIRHPGVEVSFDSRFGRLTYATDVFDDWRDNVRAITKGLEALRAVDRWGVAKRGQQYAGFALLAAGPSQEELGRQLVERHGGIREALRATHPDTGGDTASVRDFAAVQAYRAARP